MSTFVGKIANWFPEKGFGFLTGVEGNAFVALGIVGSLTFTEIGKTKDTTRSVRYEAELRPNKHGVQQWQVTEIVEVFEDGEDEMDLVGCLREILAVLERMDKRMGQLQSLLARD